MSIISGIPNPNNEVVGSELAAESFKLDGSQYKVRIDPTSNVVATESLAGIKLVAPVAAPSAVTTFLYDALTKRITLAVDGGVPQNVELGNLDDEGVTIEVSGGNLLLKNAAGTTLSTTPISQLDAQQITKTLAADKITLAVSNGGSVELKSPEIGGIFPTLATGSVDDRKQLLTKSGEAIKIKRAVSSLGTQLNYWVIDL